MQPSDGPAETDGGNPLLFSEEENATFEFVKAEIANFEDYERQFQEVLLSLESDDVLDDFRVEYNGLHHSFLKSHEGESRLMHKCLDLQGDIYTCVSKAQTAEELSQDDKHTIEHLKAEAERTRKKIDSTRDKENLLKGKIYELKKEVAALEKLSQEPVEAGAMENALQSLQRVHETVLKEKESQTFLVNSAQYEVNAAQRRMEKLRERKTAGDDDLRNIREKIELKQEEHKAITQVRQQKEEILKAVRERLATGTSALAERQERIKQLHETHDKSVEEINKVNAEVESFTEEYHSIARQLQQLNASVQECNEENDVLQKKVKETLEEVYLCQREVDGARKHNLKDSKVVDALIKRNLAVQTQLAAAESKKELERQEFEKKEEILQRRKEKLDGLEKQLVSLRREKDLLHEECLTSQEKANRNKRWLAEKDAQLKSTECDLQAFEEHSQKESMNIYKTMKECDKYEREMRAHTLSCASTIAEIKMKERQIAEEQRRASEIELRLRKQQNLLDTVTADRNTYSKHYDQLRHELSGMTRRFQLVLAQITQMKNEVIAREREVAEAEHEIETLNNQRRDVENSIFAYQKRSEKHVRTTADFNFELRQLGEILVTASEESTRQRRRCMDIIHERDLLARQTTKQEKDLMTLCEKIHAQLGMLQRGEVVYMETARHMDQLEYQIVTLEKQLIQLRQATNRLPDLRLMVNQASRELQSERVKVQAMLQECEKPINLHPHHELAWSDPETFQLVEKVTQLQRQLTQQRALLEKTEAKIAEKEGVYLTAKATVAKQPGPEVSEQLTAYHEHLIKKRTQLKQMQKSLAFFREQTEQFQHREEELRAHLNEMAKAYAQQRQQMEKEAEAVARRGLALEDSSIRSESSHDSSIPYKGFTVPPRHISPLTTSSPPAIGTEMVEDTSPEEDWNQSEYAAFEPSSLHPSTALPLPSVEVGISSQRVEEVSSSSEHDSGLLEEQGNEVHSTAEVQKSRAGEMDTASLNDNGDSNSAEQMGNQGSGDGDPMMVVSTEPGTAAPTARTTMDSSHLIQETRMSDSSHRASFLPSPDDPEDVRAEEQQEFPSRDLGV